MTNAGIATLVTEVRLADVSPDADKEAPKRGERTPLPGSELGSFSVELCKAVLESGADLPFSVSTDASTFTVGPCQTVVSSLSKQLDLLMTGQDPAELAKAAAEEAAAGEEGEEGEAAAEGGEAEAPVAAAAAPATK